MARKKRSKKKLAQIIPELLKVYRYFWSDIRSQSWLIGVSFFSLVLGVVFRLLEPWPLKFVLDQVVQQGESSSRSISLPDAWSATFIVALVSIAVVIIAAIRATTEYHAQIGFFNIGNKIVIRLRDRVYRHLQLLPMSFHDRARSGDLVVRVTRDVSLIRDVTATAILPLLASTMLLTGMTFVMFWLNWRLALIALAILPIYWISNVRFGRRIRESARKQRQREGAMATIASETIGSIRAIKALSLEKKFSADFSDKNSRSQSDDMKASRMSLRLSRIVDILLAIATATVLWVGAHFVLDGKMYASDLVVFLVYLKRAFKPAQDFSKYTARIAKATAAGERVIHLLELPVESLEQEDCNSLSEPAGAIEFRDVTFAYDTGQPVLSHFDLEIQPGKITAITGPSGAGKSTILGLLLRLYEPDSGRILIDGHDIRETSLASVRGGFAVVLQDPLLFAGSIRENINVGCPQPVSDEEMINAAHMAHVDEIVNGMLRGYDTQISERGSTLSRGQRQRLAIARAALMNKNVMLFDEPTTGLDSVNEQIVCDSLLKLCRGKTAIMVTHNPRLICRADIVVCVDNGQVQQMGSHDSLLRSAGSYRQIFRGYMDSVSDEIDDTHRLNGKPADFRFNQNKVYKP